MLSFLISDKINTSVTSLQYRFEVVKLLYVDAQKQTDKTSWGTSGNRILIPEKAGGNIFIDNDHD